MHYLARRVRQTKYELDAALLVRGEDRYQHFDADLPAESNLEPAAVARQLVLEDRYHNTVGD